MDTKFQIQFQFQIEIQCQSVIGLEAKAGSEVFKLCKPHDT